MHIPMYRKLLLLLLVVVVSGQYCVRPPTTAAPTTTTTRTTTSTRTTTTTSTKSTSTTSTTKPTSTTSTTTPTTTSSTTTSTTTTSTPTTSTSTTTPSTTSTSTSTSLTTSTTPTSTTTTTSGCSTFNDLCLVDSDCCTQGSATMLFVLRCIASLCSCTFPLYYSPPTLSNTCCDSQPSLPLTSPNGYQCPTGIHYSVCGDNTLVPNNGSCGIGLFCSLNPVSDAVFGIGTAYGICLNSADSFYG